MACGRAKEDISAASRPPWQPRPQIPPCEGEGTLSWGLIPFPSPHSSPGGPSWEQGKNSG